MTAASDTLARPMASLDAGLLDSCKQRRRTPLTFAGPHTADQAAEHTVAHSPEVVQIVSRQAQTRDRIDSRGSSPDGGSSAAAPRFAVTLWLDGERHGYLGRIAQVQGVSAQTVLTDALDHYAVSSSNVAACSPALPLPNCHMTGNQP